MFEFVKAGGFLMVPILLCSIFALTIIIERFLSLRSSRVTPKGLVEQARRLAVSDHIAAEDVKSIHDSSPLGKVLASGLDSVGLPRHVMKENVEESGRHVVHELERYLSALGTIAAVTPLLGLLGTVLGMIEVFSVITSVGVGNPGDLAEGISKALITTAAGISVAVPSLMFHRYFKSKVDGHVVTMEKEAVKLIEIANAKHKPMMPTAKTARSTHTGGRAG